MDAGLIRVIRDHYPFPIAHAHKKTLAWLDDDTQKLKCLIQTAETTIQFLALIVLAQLHRDLEHQQASVLGNQGKHIHEALRNPSFGTWNGMLRDVLKGYRDHQHLLVIPELFDFYFRPSRGKKLQVQPVVSQAIDPLITLRNQFHHSDIQALIPEKIDAGMRWLEQILTALRFLSTYELAFVQRIEVRRPTRHTRRFSHSLMQMSGCFSIFDRQRWESDIDLQQERVIMLASADGRSLFLDPFVTVADPIPVPGVFDVFLLNSIESRWARYASSQFGRELRTDRPDWPKGKVHLEDLWQFFDLLRQVPLAEADVELEWDGAAPPVQEKERATGSTEEVFTARYKRQASARQHISPYKFLDYFEPEDADLFFGRDQEIRQLQRKFHAARLLILHGESGTGKTSLIRAGLLPRLSPESYVPVYVRVLEEPRRAIKEAMIRQLGVDRRHIDLPLVPFLDAETAHLSKTVVLILDQFEEFFLRFPPEVRQAFHHELAACVTVANLDVHVIIALRDDYFALLAEFQQTMPDIFTHEMHLARLTTSQALAAAVEPVKQVGLAIDEALMAEVVLPQLDEPGQGIAPPLLQIVCDALYQHAQDASRSAIGAEDYTAIGDVRQVLERYLDTTLRQFGVQQPRARAVLKALVTAEGTKRASFVEEIVSRLQTTGMEATAEAVEQDVLRKLEQARLVRADDVDGHTRYELTHEFLVRQIGGWIAESERELTKILELIDRAYEAYRATNLLLQPEALELIAPFQEQLVLPAEKRTFLERSRHTAQQRWRRLLLKVGMLLLVVALGIGGVFGWQLHRRYKEAKQNAQHAVNVNDVLWELMERLQPAISQDPVLAHILEPGLQYAEGEFERLLQDASDNPAALTSKLRMLLVSSAVIQSSGHTDEALSRVNEARTIATQLTSQNPTHTEWQRHLALSHIRIGHVREQQGDLEGALVAYREGLAIAERLADHDPNSTQWLHDLALSQARIGSVLRQQGDLEGALVAYRKGLAIAERLTDRDPTDTQWQHTRAVIQQHIGKVFFDTGKPEAAVDVLYSALRRYKALTQQYPGNTTFAQALFDVYHLLGKLHAQQRNFAAALPAYRQAVETIERLAQHDSRITQWRQEQAKALNILAWALLTAEPADLRQPTEALTWAHRSVELSAQSSPVEQAMRLDTLAMAYHVTGDHPQAIIVAEHALRLLPPTVTEGDTLAVEVRQELETHRRCFIVQSDSSRLAADNSCPCCRSIETDTSQRVPQAYGEKK